MHAPETRETSEHPLQPLKHPQLESSKHYESLSLGFPKSNSHSQWQQPAHDCIVHARRLQLVGPKQKQTHEKVIWAQLVQVNFQTNRSDSNGRQDLIPDRNQHDTNPGWSMRKFCLGSAQISLRHTSGNTFPPVIILTQQHDPSWWIQLHTHKLCNELYYTHTTHLRLVWRKEKLTKHHESPL